MASKETTLKWLLPSVMPAVVMFIIFMPVLCGSIEVNCSKPDQPSLLEALTPVFNLSAIRPVLNPVTQTNVSVYFTLYGILGVDEKAQLLNTYIWLHYWWINEFISWDPIQCGTDKISLPKEKFWLPDIVINEFMDENKAPTVPYVYVHDIGAVHDALPVKVVSSCNLNIYTFPFDIQTCSLTFNSYIYYANEIQILLGRSAEEITMNSKTVMTTMGEWELLDITAKKLENDDLTGFYTDQLTFHVRVRRRATMYVVNLLLPSCFLITVDLFSFLLPPQNIDRSSFKMTLILGYTVFLLIMNDLLPVTGNIIPLINVFFSLCLALMVASLLETILITNLLCNSADFSPVPGWIKVLVLKFLGCLVCMPRKTKKPENPVSRTDTVVAKNGPPETKAAEDDKALQELRSLSSVLRAIRSQVEQQQQQKEKQSSEDWIQVGFIIDRLLFGLYIIFISISFITIIIIWCCPMKVKPSKHLFILISLLMSASSSSAILNCSQPNPTSLLSALQTAFDLNSIRPVSNMSTTTKVYISFTLFGILGVNEKSQVLTTFIWQSLVWKNEFTVWDSEECGIDWIAIPRKLLWVPDIVINEFMEKNTAPEVPYTYLQYEGLVLDEQPVRVVSSCRLDIYLFPFDIQNCSFTFNSYIYDINAIQLDPLSSAEDLLKASKQAMVTMGEWELVGLTSELKTIGSTNEFAYQELCYYISVRRQPVMYVLNLLIPSCFLITVDLFSFVLPAKSIDRSLFKMTLVLGYTVFLLSTNDLLPITGNTIPLINVFLSLCLSMMVTSLLETIFITNLLQGSAHYTPPPRWIRVLVLHILGRLVGLPPKPAQQEDTVIQNPVAQVTKENGTSEQKEQLNEDKTVQVLRDLSVDLQAIHRQVILQLKGGPSSEDWIQVGLIIDRLLFILYIVFITVSFITIIIIWVNSYNNI